MNNQIQDANLELLTALKEHLEHAAHLRALFDRLLSLGRVVRPDIARHDGKHDRMEEGKAK